MNAGKIHDSDLKNVLVDDGVESVEVFGYENKSTTRIDDLKAAFGTDVSWATRLVYNDRFGGVLIHQLPGEGNRLHYHEDADECWVILQGTWEWYIEGEGTRRVGVSDIVLVRQGTKHKITCIGDEPGIRLAITKPDVDHIYEKE